MQRSVDLGVGIVGHVAATEDEGSIGDSLFGLRSIHGCQLHLNAEFGHVGGECLGEVAAHRVLGEVHDLKGEGRPVLGTGAIAPHGPSRGVE